MVLLTVDDDDCAVADKDDASLSTALVVNYQEKSEDEAASNNQEFDAEQPHVAVEAQNGSRSKQKHSQDQRLMTEALYNLSIFCDITKVRWSTSQRYLGACRFSLIL
jgi:hypothetical protein